MIRRSFVPTLKIWTKLWICLEILSSNWWWNEVNVLVNVKDWYVYLFHRYQWQDRQDAKLRVTNIRCEIFFPISLVFYMSQPLSTHWKERRDMWKLTWNIHHFRTIPPGWSPRKITPSNKCTLPQLPLPLSQVSKTKMLDKQNNSHL